jgi:hypothetical protein
MRKGDRFDDFPLQRITEIARAGDGNLGFLAGTATCASEPCDRRFGAALATIEQVEYPAPPFWAVAIPGPLRQRG